MDSSNFIYLYYLLCFYEDNYFVIDEITLGNEGSDYLTLIEVSDNSINNESISDFDKRILFRWEKKFDQNNFNLFVNKIKVNNKEIIFYTKEKFKLNDIISFNSGIKSKKKIRRLEIGK